MIVWWNSALTDDGNVVTVVCEWCVGGLEWVALWCGYCGTVDHMEMARALATGFLSFCTFV